MDSTITTIDLNKIWSELGKQNKVIEFYSLKDQLPQFSNFYRHDVFTYTIPDWCGCYAGTAVNIQFAEQAIMLCKASLMNDKNTFNKLTNVKTPKAAKALGRKITPFNEALWQKWVCEIAKSVVIAKFTLVAGLSQLLLQTGEYLIVEATTRDKNWGIGLNINDPKILDPSEWKGSNILGWALMKARNEIK